MSSTQSVSQINSVESGKTPDFGHLVLTRRMGEQIHIGQGSTVVISVTNTNTRGAIVTVDRPRDMPARYKANDDATPEGVRAHRVYRLAVGSSLVFGFLGSVRVKVVTSDTRNAVFKITAPRTVPVYRDQLLIPTRSATRGVA